MNEYLNELIDRVISTLGEDETLDQLLRALNYDQKLDCFEYIARNNDIETGGEGE